MKIFSLLTALSLAFASACGGGGRAPMPVATTDNMPRIDPNLLPAIVLQASELPPGLAQEGSFNPPGDGSARSFANSFSSQSVIIASSVAQYQDPKSIEVPFGRLRKALVKLIGPESGYQLAGADAAFLYRSGSGALVATAVLRGSYVINVDLQTRDDSAEAAHVADVQRYTELVFGRLQKALADPSSVSPVAGAPTFDPSRLTPRPQSTGTP